MKNTLLVFFVLCIGIIFGQNKNQKNQQQSNLKPNELDQTYTPPVNSIFDEDSKKNNLNSAAVADFRNVIRFNPLLLPRSVAAIGYERTLNDYIGLEAYLGYSYKLDWIQAYGTAISGGEFSMGNNQSAISVSEMIGNGTFKSGGIFSSLGLKVYMDGTPFEGNYFGIQGRYNSYNLDLNNLNYSFASSEYATTTIKNITTIFQWGTCVIGGTSKVPIVHDFYTGIGIRSSSYDIYNEQNTDMETKYIKTNQRESFIGFSYVIGYSIGFGFNTKKVNKQ